MKIKKIIKTIILYKYLVFLGTFFLFCVFNFFRRKIDYFNVRENSTLLIEFYRFHGETLPGFIKYLLDLNYYVDVVILSPNGKKGRNDLSIFSCFNDNEKVRIKTLPDYDMNFLMRSSIAASYKHIIINSFFEGKRINCLSFVNLFKLQPVCVVHNTNIQNEYFQTNKIISLVKIESDNRKPTLVVNPHYFGEFERKKKSKKATFIAFNTNNLHRRNLNLLFAACDKLCQKGINNFSIKIIGTGIPIPERYSENIHDYGFLDFQRMFEEISNSDFLLALLDHENIQYTNKASGSYQISYGFLKPIVLHALFSNVSGFTNENSVLYNDNNNLAEAIEKCVNMSNNDYQTLVSSLEIHERKLYDSSLNNLKEVLETPIQNVSAQQDYT